MTYVICIAKITNSKNDISNVIAKITNSKNDICNMYSKNYKQQK